MKCYSIISGKNGERLFDHIVFDKFAKGGGGFSIGKDFFSCSPSALSDMEIKTVKIHKHSQLVSRQGLISFDLEKSPMRLFEKTHNFDGDPKFDDLPYISLVFIQGPKQRILNRFNKMRTGVSLRCPQPKEYWKAWVAIERSGDKENIKNSKQGLKTKYPANTYIEDMGARVVLPSAYHDTNDNKINFSTYLVAMTSGSSFEAVYARQGRLPNTYRVECGENGEISLLNPREEVSQ